MQVPCVNIDEAQSYHVDVEAPYDVEIHDAALIAPLGPDHEQLPIGDDDQSLTRSHMFVHPPARDLSGVLVDLKLAPVTTGMVRSTTLISMIIAAILVLAVLYASSVSAPDLFMHPDRSSSTALLLLAPAVLAAVLAAPSRHSMTTRLLWETRLTVGVSCLAMFVAATAVALRVEQARLVVTLLAAFTLALLSMLRLLIQFVRLRRSRVHSKARLRQQTGAP